MGVSKGVMEVRVRGGEGGLGVLGGRGDAAAGRRGARARRELVG